MGNEETKKNDLKRTIEDGDSAMIPLCLDTNKLTVKWWLGKSMRTVKKIKYINDMRFQTLKVDIKNKI